MAVSTGGFSIREYAAEIRKVDARKSWPFRGDVRENLLPPIECRRHRWWSSALQIFRSTENTERERGSADRLESDSVDAGCEIGNQDVYGSGRDLVASPILSVSERNEKEKTSIQGKNKARSPKRRSITELIAVPAPIVASVEQNENNAEGEAARISIEDRIAPKEIAKDRGKKRPNMTRKGPNRKRKDQLLDSIFEEVLLDHAKILTRPSTVEKFTKSNTQPPADVAVRPYSVANKVTDSKITETERTVPEEISNGLTDASLDFNASETSGSDLRPSDKGHLLDDDNNSNHSGLSVKQNLPTLGSPHMKSLYKVFSDVLTAASAAHNSLKITDRPVMENSGERNQVSSISAKPVNLPNVIDTDGPFTGSVEKCTGMLGNRIAFAEIVDLNNPAESSGSPCEPDSSEQEERIMPNVAANFRSLAISTGETQPLIPLAVPLPPAVSSNAASVSLPSAVIIKRKRTTQDTLDEGAYPHLPLETVSSVSFQTWLPSKPPQRDTLHKATYFQRSHKKDILTSLPLNSQGELAYMQSTAEEGLQKLQRMEAWSPFRRNRQQVHNIVDSFSPIFNSQHSSKTQFRWEPGRKGPNASEVSLNNHNEATFAAITQLPTMRLMGKDVTVGVSNNELQGATEAGSIIDQRTVSCSDPDTGLPGAQRVSYMPAHQPVCQILDKPTNSNSFCFNFNRQSDDSVLAMGGINMIPARHHYPAQRSQPHAAKTWLGREVLGIGVEVPLNIDHSFAINSGYQKQGEHYSNPVNHIRTPSIQPLSQDLSLWLGNEGLAQFPGPHFPCFPMSSPLLQTSHNFSFHPALRFSSLPTYNMINRIDKNGSTSACNGVMKPKKIAEHPHIYGQNNGYRNLNANDTAMDGPPRSRPVKLCAGAKHILMPGLKMTDPKNPSSVSSSATFSGEFGST